ncbi:MULTISPECIES: glutamyl-tRNA reductase [Clostridium]|uniref:Glutamyl-tRNA reductase n=1 Tax=Clostridium senegalense TaxID=1465809 RepID=A0A6M0H6T5_9CLOT|nr:MULTISPECIES: glutamyl-tRNA reductase [Clostridium]NEU06237.1 glutamyl-tRNA reductase [Clostridium senegalense]
MVRLIGLNKDVTLDVRSRFSINSSDLESNLLNLKSFLDEVIIISTCNRTEVYFSSQESNNDLLVEKIFITLNWDINDIKYTFISTGENAVRHIMELCCGFHSKILGEDQILGQVKDGYFKSLELNVIKGPLERLFINAIGCGKEFKTETMLYKIPVSSSSIAIKEAINKQKRIFMIIGFGDVGKLCFKNLLVNDNNFDRLYIACRDIEKVKNDDLIKNSNDKVEIIHVNDKNKYLHKIDVLISCTSSKNFIIKKNDVEDIKNLLIFDLAVPRDVCNSIDNLLNITVYDIDEIHTIDAENKKLRKTLMEEHYYIVKKYMYEYLEWVKLRSLSPHIMKMIKKSNIIYSTRFKTYTQKKFTKDNDKLVETLIKSTSNAYVNRAIEVLKEETLNGKGKEALSIIEKIFCDI